jgi:hypothetical protein
VESFRLEQIEARARDSEKVIARWKHPELATEELAGQTESFWLEVRRESRCVKASVARRRFARAVVRVSGGDLESALAGGVGEDPI